MYDLTKFTLKEMTICGAGLRQLGSGAHTMEEAATRLTRYLYDHLVDRQTGAQTCALVRFFKTHPYQDLQEELQAFARRRLDGQTIPRGMKCLVLLATAGERAEWCSRQDSAAHQAIPLVSVNVVEEAPMIANLIRQFGLEIPTLLKADPSLLLELEQQHYNVFYVPHALGSPLVPHQDDFVIPYGIQSVLGFGGVLPSGNLFATVLFSKVPVVRETANLFKTLALSVKLAILPFDGHAVFAAQPSAPRRGDDCMGINTHRHEELQRRHSQVAALSQVLDVYEQTVLQQTSRLERALAKLQRVRDELEIRVQERTAQLVQANDGLQAKNEELRVISQQLWQSAKLATMGELAASIAHELNNPLSTVTLRVESLLMQAPTDDPKRNVLEVIAQEVERMGALVANLLQFTRTTPQISTLDVRDEIDKTLDLIHYHLRKHGIHVVREFAPDAPMIRADRQHLRQLFLNLLTNASDAMPQGGTLTIRVAASQKDSQQLVTEVADTGLGIPPELLPKVTEPFVTTKPEGKGTGLGLAICQRIVQEHHGTLEIFSTGIPGHGTTVRIVLPVANGKNRAYLQGTEA